MMYGKEQEKKAGALRERKLPKSLMRLFWASYSEERRAPRQGKKILRGSW